MTRKKKPRKPHKKGESPSSRRFTGKWLFLGIVLVLGLAGYFLGPSLFLGDPGLRRMREDRDMIAAREAFKAKDFKKAAALFESAGRRHPRRPEPLLGLSEVFLRVKKAKNALNAANEACKAAPENGRAHLLLGRALEATGQNDRAIAAYTKAAELDREDPEPFYRLGLLADKQLQVKLSENYYSQSLAIDPHYAPAAHHMASRFMEAGQYGDAVALLENALLGNPEDTRLQLNLALTYLKKGDAHKAVQAFQVVLKKAPDMTMPHYHLGCALDLLDRHDEAIAAFEKAVLADPYFFNAWYSLSQTLKKQGKPADAELALKKFEIARALATRINRLEGFLKNNPNDVKALVALGEALLKRQKNYEAYTRLSRALELDPQNRQAKSLLKAAVEKVDEKKRKGA